MYNYSINNFSSCQFEQTIEEQIYGVQQNKQYCSRFSSDNPSCQWNGYTVSNTFPYWENGLSYSSKRARDLKLKYVSDKLARERQLRRNARERARQNRLNDAFDVLRNSLPGYLAPNKKQGKLTQMETLTLAKYYISLLQEVLDTGNENSIALKEEN